MRAPKTKGIGWDVSESFGSSDGSWQIQRIDDPTLDDDEPYTKPAFDGDDDAIRHVIKRAKAGDKETIDALWEVLPHDGLVNRILWNMNFKSFPIAFVYPE